MIINNNYINSYSQPALWKHIATYAKKAGKQLVMDVLLLYYAMKLGKASPKDIAIILGALGYFISPIDIIPDVLTGGFTDDMSVIMAAIKLVEACNDPEVVRAAKTKINQWF